MSVTILEDYVCRICLEQNMYYVSPAGSSSDLLGSGFPWSLGDLTAEAGHLWGLLQTSSTALGLLSADMDRKFTNVDASL